MKPIFMPSDEIACLIVANCVLNDFLSEVTNHACCRRHAAVCKLIYMAN